MFGGNSGGFQDKIVDYAYNFLLMNPDTTGSMDISSLLQSALDSGNNNIYMPSGTYLISNKVTMGEGQRIFGDGYTSVLKTTSNVTMIEMSDYCSVEDFKMLGSYDYDFYITQPNPVDSSISSQKGLYWTQKIGINIRGIWCFNFGGYGIDWTTNTLAGRQYTSSMISESFCVNNLYGLRAASQGEYVTIDTVHSCYNAYGIRIDAGNIAITGGSYNGNIRGIWMTGGTNNGHCTISGAKINHNTSFSLYLANIDKGHIISGCAIFYGIIYLGGSKGILFDGNEINFDNASNDYIQAGNSQAKFVGTIWHNLRPRISDNTGSLGYSDITFTECKQRSEMWIASTSDNTPTTVYSYTMIDNTSIVFDLEVMAYGVSGTMLAASFRRRFGVNKITGAPTVEFSQTIGTDFVHASFAGATIGTPSISGNAVIIEATGIGATDLRWKVTQYSEARVQ